MTNNPDQHKQQITAVFNRIAAGYDNPAMRYFPFCGDRLVALLNPRPDQKILDVATGTGAAAMAAAQAIGPQGRVQAIDLSESMLDKAFTNIQRMGLNNTDFHVMDAEKLDFKSQYFDAVMCSFGIFFLPDMLKGLKEWRRVVKPGGKVIFTSFTKNAFHPMAALFREQIRVFGVEFPGESWQRLSTEAECIELLNGAGFINTAVHTEQMGYHLNSAQEWWGVIMNSGFRGFLDRLDTEQQAAFRPMHLEQIQKLLTDKGLWLDVEAMFAVGQKQD